MVYSGYWGPRYYLHGIKTVLVVLQLSIILFSGFQSIEKILIVPFLNLFWLLAAFSIFLVHADTVNIQ